MSHFNLIDEPWIPLRLPDGRRVEWSLRDTLLQARNISTIEDASPLVVASLHRFLLAVLYRALEGPTDIDQARAWFKNGWPVEKIEAYLEQWRVRFDLFDEAQPFFQIADFKPKVWKAWTVLAAEHNADNAKVLFDHIDVAGAGSVSASRAARWLLAAQTFSVSAGKSELSHTGTAPSATAAMALPLGNNLQDTLLLSLVPQNRAVMVEDFPVWERTAETIASLKNGIGRPVAGFADLYSWRTRSIRLQRNDAGGVSVLAFASGVEAESTEMLDPMLAYREDEKKGRLPIQFRERGLWRDFDSLLPDGGDLRPAVIEHATALTRRDLERFPRSVVVLGQANNKAKIEYWRMERFTLPQALLGNRAIRTEIRQLLDDAEKAQKSLWQGCRQFARDLLSRGEREPDGKDVSKFVQQMIPTPFYWSRLEEAFHHTLHHYTLERDAEEIRAEWLQRVRAALKSAWSQHAASVSTGDAWAIRALVRAESAIATQVQALSAEIKKYQRHQLPQEDAA